MKLSAMDGRDGWRLPSGWRSGRNPWPKRCGSARRRRSTVSERWRRRLRRSFRTLETFASRTRPDSTIEWLARFFLDSSWISHSVLVYWNQFQFEHPFLFLRWCSNTIESWNTFRRDVPVSKCPTSCPQRAKVSVRGCLVGRRSRNRASNVFLARTNDIRTSHDWYGPFINS